MIEVFDYELNRFLINLKAELPSYAIPLFLRVVRNLDITGATDECGDDDDDVFITCSNVSQEHSKSGNWIWYGKASTLNW